jgi:protein SCO1/2
MKEPTRSIEWVTWGGLICVLLAIPIFFLIARFQKSGARASGHLPVLGTVTAFALTNQQDKVISLEDLRGHVWVADIIFTRCPGPCTRMTQAMRALQDALPADGAVRFISLTADPDFDTPAVLNQYSRKHGASPALWSFLTGNKRDVYQLATRGLLLAVQETEPATRESDVDLFVHSTRFSVVDRRGRIRGSFDGADQESRRQILAAVRELLDENTE